MTKPSEPEMPTLGTSEAAESLLNLRGSNLLDTRVEALAQTIGLGLTRKAPSELTPEEFIHRSDSVLASLESGPAASSKHELAGLETDEYEEIRKAVPELARVAFPKDFAIEVERQVVGEVEAIESDLAEEPKESEEQPPDVVEEENEETSEDLPPERKIVRKITEINSFVELVLDGAQDFIVGMDWAHFNLDQAKVVESFNKAAIPTILSAKGIEGVDIFTGNYGRGLGGGYVAGALSKMTTKIMGKDGPYYVGMTNETISPGLATFIKDELSLKGVEAIARSRGLEPAEVMPHVFKAGGYGSKVQQLVKRRRRFIETRSVQR